jgi:hypothetical protein
LSSTLKDGVAIGVLSTTCSHSGHKKSVTVL